MADVLTSDQEAFAVEYAKQTGMNVNVVRAQELAEESGSAAQAYERIHFQDWLNIGIPTGSSTDPGYSYAPFFSSPQAAADASAAWVEGKSSIPNFGKASSGIENVFAQLAAGNLSRPEQQISALQGSGWAGGGYGSLMADYLTVEAHPPSSGSNLPGIGGYFNPENWPQGIANAIGGAGSGSGGIVGGVTGAVGDAASSVVAPLVSFFAGVWSWIQARLVRLGLLLAGAVLIVLSIALLAKSAGATPPVPVPA